MTYEVFQEGLEKELEKVVQVLQDFPKVRNRITFRLVYRERNRESLDGIVFMPFLDLAVLFVISQENEDGTTVTLKIPIYIFEKWNISIQELYLTALENMWKESQAQIRPLSEVIGIDAADAPDFPLYVLTNIRGFYGAGCILYPNVIKRFADRFGKDVIILPSSVHEVLLLLDDGMPVRALGQIVHEVNENVVSPEEVLSERVYRYRQATGRIEYAGEEALEEAV